MVAIVATAPGERMREREDRCKRTLDDSKGTSRSWMKPRHVFFTVAGQEKRTVEEDVGGCDVMGK